jgi:hypothetical protein
MLFLLPASRSVEYTLNTCLLECYIYYINSPMIDLCPVYYSKAFITHNIDLPSNPITQNQNMPVLTVLIKWIIFIINF